MAKELGPTENKELKKFQAFLKTLYAEGKLQKFLVLEKKRRGVAPERLVFIGIADTAEFWWCAKKSLLKNKTMEPYYFASYLEDRIKYALELGYIKQIPLKPDRLLSIGADITLEEINFLLKKRSIPSGLHRTPLMMFWDADGNQVWVIKNLSDLNLLSPPFPNKIVLPGDKSVIQQARQFVSSLDPNIEVENLDQFPRLKGEVFQLLKSEKYPTIRWNFEWENYVLVGVPDGITDRLVYEFKTTRSKFLEFYLKPVALAQADLYGYFFGRDLKRVQIYVVEENRVDTWEEEIDKNNALETLERFKLLDDTGKAVPPKEWKCKRCEFNKLCANVDKRC